MALPTFRLYVGHGRPLSNAEYDELREQLASFGPLKELASRPEWRYAFASFQCTQDAIRARKDLDGSAAL